MGKIFTIAAKDLRILLRDKGSIFWVLMFPLMIALFFGSIFSGGGGQTSGMNIAVVDNDNSDYSKAYIEELSGLSALKVRSLPRDSALQLVRQGKLSAYVVMREGFGQNYGLFTDTAMIEVGIDPARQMTAGYLVGLLTRANFTLLHKRYGTIDAWQTELDSMMVDSSLWSGAPPEIEKLGRSVISNLRSISEEIESSTQADSSSDSSSDSTAAQKQFELFSMEMTAVTNDDIGPRSAFEVTFPSAVLWALIGLAAMFAVSIVKERTAGTFMRLRLAPITRAHILAGKGLGSFTACLAICFALLIIGNLIFGVRFANPLILLIAVVSAGLCFVGMAMLFSVMGKTEESVGGAAWGILMVAAMTGGGMIPVMFMPDWLLTISNFSPVKWGILAIEGGIWRNFTLSEMILPVGMLLLIGSVCFIIGVTILARSDG
ncbi:MAG: ABC transporter permease [FCB group bacterium]|nr:ABC transporter permease [FCB group bacterium]